MPHTIRPATPTDVPLIAGLIRDLAEYERLSHAVRFTEPALARHLFGPHPAAEVVIGEIDAAACGFALFFQTFSTFEGRPGLWLEDLYVCPQARGVGLGKALLAHCAALAVTRGCARLEWSVLEWNTPALALYHAMGATLMEEWRIMRLDGGALAQLRDKT